MQEYGLREEGEGGAYAVMSILRKEGDCSFSRKTSLYLLLIIGVKLYRFLHVIEVDPQIFDGGDGVVVTHYLRYRFYPHSCVEEGSTERPSEGVVGEFHIKTVSHFVDHSAVYAVSSVGLMSGVRPSDVTAPQEKVAGVLP